MAVERVDFMVAGQSVVGNFHLPDGAGPHSGAIVAGPMTSVKEQVTGVYASALAARGVAALAIDHRHFGESGGDPRGYEHCERKVEDLRAALLASLPDVSGGRIVGVGVCLALFSSSASPGGVVERESGGQGLPRRLSDLEQDWSGGLLLDHCRPLAQGSALDDVAQP